MQHAKIMKGVKSLKPAVQYSVTGWSSNLYSFNWLPPHTPAHDQQNLVSSQCLVTMTLNRSRDLCDGWKRKSSQWRLDHTGLPKVVLPIYMPANRHKAFTGALHRHHRPKVFRKKLIKPFCQGKVECLVHSKECISNSQFSPLHNIK